ncbi:MAG: N-acetylneuraminate lyase [Eubacteriales bacterium]|nr:N-acetylneuraminate lyase [Eubacteriales bacterium]
MENFKGIFPALLTPFDGEDRINDKALESLIKMNMEKGVKGFYVGGSTAEAFLMSNDERKHIFDVVKSATKGECTLIAHIGCIATNQAIELGRYACDLGYDGISSIPPFYYKFTFEEIKKYYYDIVDSVNLPMIIYNFPNFSGVTLTADNIGEFLNDPRFIGVKHTSSDYFTMEQIKSRYPDKLVYNGFDETFMAGLSMGADGGIGSTYNFMAEKFVKIYDLFHNGEIAAAQEIQKTANKIISVLCKVGVLQGEKAMLEIMGIEFGECRAPFIGLTSEQKEMLTKEILPLL